MSFDIVASEFIGWLPFRVVLTSQEKYTILETERATKLGQMLEALDVQVFSMVVQDDDCS